MTNVHICRLEVRSFTFFFFLAFSQPHRGSINEWIVAGGTVDENPERIRPTRRQTRLRLRTSRKHNTETSTARLRFIIKRTGNIFGARRNTRVKTGGLFAAVPGHGTWWALVLLLCGRRVTPKSEKTTAVRSARAHFQYRTLSPDDWLGMFIIIVFPYEFQTFFIIIIV